MGNIKAKEMLMVTGMSNMRGLTFKWRASWQMTGSTTLAVATLLATSVTEAHNTTRMIIVASGESSTTFSCKLNQSLSFEAWKHQIRLFVVVVVVVCGNVCGKLTEIPSASAKPPPSRNTTPQDILVCTTFQVRSLLISFGSCCE